ncbi:MAG: serine hydrolase [Gemmatimonadales bacterium]|jgi:beta-lactamase class A|nr:MAG: serine hydrolase [Gemmatimonadales bacterium]
MGCTVTKSFDPAALAEALSEPIAASDAEVGVYFRNLGTGDTVLINADLRLHAASTMKVPVMIQLFRDAEAGRFDIDQPVPIGMTFRSIADGSLYDIDPASDSDSTLYQKVGSAVPARELIDLMITRSSNLATNILIELADARRVTATMRSLGADSIEVLRGVEDLKAYRAGLSNTTTARDLGVILTALAEGRAAGESATADMLAILEHQEFNEGIPAGLPAGTRVAHKTGWITAIDHDAAIVYPDGGPPYVLVVLVRGIEDHAVSSKLIATLSGITYRALRDEGN